MITASPDGNHDDEESLDLTSEEKRDRRDWTPDSVKRSRERMRGRLSYLLAGGAIVFIGCAFWQNRIDVDLLGKMVDKIFFLLAVMMGFYFGERSK